MKLKLRTKCNKLAGLAIKLRPDIIIPGYPIARTRVYAIGTHRMKAKWLTDKPLHELVAQHACKRMPGFTPDSYYYVRCVQQQPLTAAQKKHLSRYAAEHSHMDLNQDPGAKRGRTTTSEGLLPTLTASTRSIYSRHAGRNLLGEEMLACHVIPTKAAHAKAAGIKVPGPSKAGGPGAVAE